MERKARGYIENLVKILRETNASPIIPLEIIEGIILSFFSLFVFVDIARDVLEKEGAIINNTISQFI